MRPSVASPSSPPKVITGDMQAQYRNRKEAKHCRLSASVKSDRKCGAFLFTSRTNPPKNLTKNTRHPSELRKSWKTGLNGIQCHTFRAVSRSTENYINKHSPGTKIIFVKIKHAFLLNCHYYNAKKKRILVLLKL